VADWAGYFPTTTNASARNREPNEAKFTTVEISEMARPWQEVVAEKTAVRETLIEKHCRNIDIMQVEDITAINTIYGLRQRLEDGNFTAEDVVHAYIKQSVKPFRGRYDHDSNDS
jgi:hypothetical protein